MYNNVNVHIVKWDRDHTVDQIIGNPDASVRTRRATKNEWLCGCFLSQDENKKINDAFFDPDWIVMQEELNQFERKKSMGACSCTKEQIHYRYKMGFYKQNRWRMCCDKK